MKIASISCLLACASLSLSAQVNVGSVSLSRSNTTKVTVTITQAGTLHNLEVVTGGAANLDFADGHIGTCAIGKTYEVGDTCTVNVTFAPRLTGTRSGAVSLSDPFKNPMAVTYIQGQGVGPQTAFQPATLIPVFGNLNNVAELAVDASYNVYAAESETSSGEPGSPALPGGVFEAGKSVTGYTYSDIGTYLIDPVGVAIDGNGNVFESDGYLSPWMILEPSDVAQPAYFREEQTLAVDAAGFIYTAGYGSVYRSTPVLASTRSYMTIASGLGNIQSVAVDGGGNVYFPDSGSVPAVYKAVLQPNGSYTQTEIGSGWVKPVALTVDANGTVYVDDSGSIYALTPVSGGSYTRALIYAGQKNVPVTSGLAVDGGGNLYLPVFSGQNEFGPAFDVYKLDREAPPALNFAATAIDTVSSDSPKTVVISNQGNSPLKFSEISYPRNFRESKSGSNHCSSKTELAPNQSCNVVIEFLPEGRLIAGLANRKLSTGVVVVTNNLGQPATRQTIAVTGATKLQ